MHQYCIIPTVCSKPSHLGVFYRCTSVAGLSTQGGSGRGPHIRAEQALPLGPAAHAAAAAAAAAATRQPVPALRTHTAHPGPGERVSAQGGQRPQAVGKVTTIHVLRQHQQQQRQQQVQVRRCQQCKLCCQRSQPHTAAELSDLLESYAPAATREGCCRAGCGTHRVPPHLHVVEQHPQQRRHDLGISR